MAETEKKVFRIFTNVLTIILILAATLITLYDAFISPEITGGTIVEKTVEDANAIKPMDYRLCIKYAVNIGPITIRGKDWCSVDKETYLKAQNGMYYNKKTLQLVGLDGEIIGEAYNHTGDNSNVEPIS